MVAEGAPFRGVLFAGLMIKDGRVRPVGVGRSGLQAPASRGNMQPGSVVRRRSCWSTMCGLATRSARASSAAWTATCCPCCRRARPHPVCSVLHCASLRLVQALCEHKHQLGRLTNDVCALVALQHCPQDVPGAVWLVTGMLTTGSPAPSAGCVPGPAGGCRPEVVRPSGAHGGDGGARVPGQLRQGRRHRRARQHQHRQGEWELNTVTGSTSAHF